MAESESVTSMCRGLTARRTCVGEEVVGHEVAEIGWPDPTRPCQPWQAFSIYYKGAENPSVTFYTLPLL